VFITVLAWRQRTRRVAAVVAREATA
jgi:hypothetical protein